MICGKIDEFLEAEDENGIAWSLKIIADHEVAFTSANKSLKKSIRDRVASFVKEHADEAIPQDYVELEKLLKSYK